MIYAFKNKASFIILEIKSECCYYLEARKKNRDSISNLITWNLSDKSMTAHKKFTACSKQGSFTFEIELAPFECLFWNDNGSVLRLMVSITSGISLWYRPWKIC